ncbi:hypothetical protein ANCDUO_11640 [Ancylostoma duodenale]|uniref:Uncharacterized protein n=1 Tax=Ancylostoma duodenale TaxID=51022 RepID=A0A0C2GB03_9BILA|nr:hypothetical protein ANCDUO_11640 [Ancylostoma duodenale]
MGFLLAVVVSAYCAGTVAARKSNRDSFTDPSVVTRARSLFCTRNANVQRSVGCPEFKGRKNQKNVALAAKHCDTFAQSYVLNINLSRSYGGAYGGNTGSYGGDNGFPDYQTWSRRHGRRRHHKKKKFRFETLEELESSMSAANYFLYLNVNGLKPMAKAMSGLSLDENDFPTHSSATKLCSHKQSHKLEEESLQKAKRIEEFPSPPSSTSAPRSSTPSWEDEDLWERKFVNPKSKTKTSEGISEEFPEISSAEIAAARARMRGRGEEVAPSPAAASLPAPATRPPGGGGVGLGSGVGVGGIGVNSGLGIGAPGIGGLGGGGGLFGISSGVGVGVPGVGPIGLSSDSLSDESLYELYVQIVDENLNVVDIAARQIDKLLKHSVIPVREFLQANFSLRISSECSFEGTNK